MGENSNCGGRRQPVLAARPTSAEATLRVVLLALLTIVAGLVVIATAVA
jgi:hypothetical protein